MGENANWNEVINIYIFFLDDKKPIILKIVHRYKRRYAESLVFQNEMYIMGGYNTNQKMAEQSWEIEL